MGNRLKDIAKETTLSFFSQAGRGMFGEEDDTLGEGRSKCRRNSLLLFQNLNETSWAPWITRIESETSKRSEFSLLHLA